MHTSSITYAIAGVEVLETFGRSSELPGFSFITLVALAIASTPDSARTIPTKPFQLAKKPPDKGFRLCRAWPRCGTVKIPRHMTTIAVGTETRNAKPPVCLGPK